MESRFILKYNHYVVNCGLKNYNSIKIFVSNYFRVIILSTILHFGVCLLVVRFSLLVVFPRKGTSCRLNGNSLQTFMMVTAYVSR